MITLKQVEALVWLARLGRFDRAASRLNITQSTMSKRIQELEAVVGFDVVDRSAREARLTTKGEHLVSLGEDLLLLQQQAMALKSTEQMPKRRLRFGVTELSALTWLPRLASLMATHYPSVRFEPEVDLGRSLYQKLQDDLVDIIVIPDTFRAPEFTSIPVSDVENMWVASERLMGGVRHLSLEDLSRMTILTQGRKSGSGLLVDQWMKENGIALPNQMLCDSLVAIVGLTVAGIGVSYLPRQCFRPMIKRRKLVEIHPDIGIPDIRYVAMYRNDQPNKFIAEVVGQIKAICDFSRQFQ